MELLNDFNTSVKKAFTEIDPSWEKYPGLVVCGTHKPVNAEETIEKIRQYRESRMPFLGICMGLQLGVIEYCRNVLGIKGATSQELEPDSPNAVVIKMNALRVGIRKVGQRWESHWHHYMVEPSIFELLQKDFRGIICEGVLEEIGAYNQRYLAVQYHPEYQSNKDSPHPLLVSFLNTCRNLGN